VIAGAPDIRNVIALLDTILAAPACPYTKSSIKMKLRNGHWWIQPE